MERQIDKERMKERKNISLQERKTFYVRKKERKIENSFFLKRILTTNEMI